MDIRDIHIYGKVDSMWFQKCVDLTKPLPPSKVHVYAMYPSDWSLWKESLKREYQRIGEEEKLKGVVSAFVEIGKPNQRKLVGNEVFFTRYMQMIHQRKLITPSSVWQSVAKTRFKNFLLGKKHRSFVQMSFCAGEDVIGKVVIMLFSDYCPLSVERFLALSNNASPKGYNGSSVDFIVPKQYLAIESSLNVDNLENLPDESFELSHHKPGLIGWHHNAFDRHAGRGPIYISLDEMTDFDRDPQKKVAFGRVIVGLRTLRFLSSRPVDRYNRPEQSITVSIEPLSFE